MMIGTGATIGATIGTTIGTTVGAIIMVHDISVQISQMVLSVVRLMRSAPAARVLDANVQILNLAMTKSVHQIMIVKEVLVDMQTSAPHRRCAVSQEPQRVFM